MTDTCPHLEYREGGGDASFDVARAFCTVTGSFVQPMRADICTARYGLDPETDCEFYVDPGTKGDDDEGHGREGAGGEENRGAGNGDDR